RIAARNDHCPPVVALVAKPGPALADAAKILALNLVRRSCRAVEETLRETNVNNMPLSGKRVRFGEIKGQLGRLKGHGIMCLYNGTRRRFVCQQPRGNIDSHTGGFGPINLFNRVGVYTVSRT